MNDSKRIPVGFSPEDRKSLEGISKKTGAPMSEIIRRAVAEYIARWGGGSIDVAKSPKIK